MAQGSEHASKAGSRQSAEYQGGERLTHVVNVPARTDVAEKVRVWAVFSRTPGLVLTKGAGGNCKLAVVENSAAAASISAGRTCVDPVAPDVICYRNSVPT